MKYRTTPLKAKTAKNLGYMSFNSIFVRAGGMLSTIVLMKILTPYDYGVVAISMILMSFFMRLETFGTNAAIIQKDIKDINEVILNTGFTIKMAIAIVLFLISFIIAPYWAKMYNENHVVLIIRFSSLTFLLSSFCFVPDILVRKRLEFRKYLLPNIGRVLSRSVFAIAFAIMGFRYWSLIFGTFIGEVTRVLIFNKISPWSIKFRFDKIIAKDLFAFGIWIVISGLLYSIYSIVDQVIIGKMLGTIMLGYYAIAYRWGHFTSSSIKPIFQTVMFPTFSTIRNDTAKLHRGYLNSLKYISLVVFPITIGWIFLADIFILSVIGSKWGNAIVPLQILSVSGLLRSLHVGGSLFAALGRPKINTGIMTGQMVILCILIYPFTLLHGVNGAALAVVITFAVSTVYLLYKVSQLIRLPLQHTLKVFIIPATSSLGMGVILFIARHLHINVVVHYPVLEFLLLVMVGAISYLAFLSLFTHGEIVGEVKEVLHILRLESGKVDAKAD